LLARGVVGVLAVHLLGQLGLHLLRHLCLHRLDHVRLGQLDLRELWEVSHGGEYRRGEGSGHTVGLVGLRRKWWQSLLGGADDTRRICGGPEALSERVQRQ
jgi:hypothetical protein